jgi:hypothetical protein
MRDTIEKLRETLPPLLTIKQYCHLRNRCQASAYGDLKRYRGLGVKDGRATRIIRDIALDIIASLPLWTPEKERGDDKKPISAAIPAATVSKPHRDPPKRVSVEATPARDRPPKRAMRVSAMGGSSK